MLTPLMPLSLLPRQAGGAAWAGPLDDYATSAIAAFSVTKAPFAGSEQRSAIRLRRSSDNAESDFGFVKSGSDYVLDTAAISTFKGAATLYVRYLYDITGNGNHLEQSTAGSQPTFALTGGPGNGPYWDHAAGTKNLVPVQTFTAHTGDVTIASVQNYKAAFRRGWVMYSGALAAVAADDENIFANARATGLDSAVLVNAGATIGPVITVAALWHGMSIRVAPAGSPKIRFLADATTSTSSPASIVNAITKVGISTVSTECYAGAIYWLRGLSDAEQDAVHAWMKGAHGL